MPSKLCRMLTVQEANSLPEQPDNQTLQDHPTFEYQGHLQLTKIPTI